VTDPRRRRMRASLSAATASCPAKLPRSGFVQELLCKVGAPGGRKHGVRRVVAPWCYVKLARTGGAGDAQLCVGEFHRTWKRGSVRRQPELPRASRRRPLAPRVAIAIAPSFRAYCITELL
jgi:hypothetical protein